MRCREVRQQLSIYRELGAVEQDELRRHVSGCLACTECWSVYQAQDRLLSTLVPITPSPESAKGIHSRIIASRRPALRPAWRRSGAVAVVLLILFSLGGLGIVSAAAETLPGDLLYPVKLAAEEVRLAVILDPASRTSYEKHLEEKRREEVREVTRRGRQAQVRFQGSLESVDNDVWVVGGVTVQVAPEVWADLPPARGSVIWVEGEAAKGEVSAFRIRVRHTSFLTVEPAVSPVPSRSPVLSPSPATPWPTPTGGTTPTSRRPDPKVTATRHGRGPVPTAVPSSEAAVSQTPPRPPRVPGVGPSRTPQTERRPRGSPTPGGGRGPETGATARPPSGPAPGPTTRPPSGPTPAPPRPGGRGGRNQ